jgi:protein-L-isoaspartate O-methyltransferase
MLIPSCEAKIIQAMEFHSNDNVLVVGTGSGYLVECISCLSNTVSSYEIDLELFEFAKRNLDLYSQNRHKIFLNHNNIMNCLDKITMYKKVLFTCSVDSYLPFIKYLDVNARCFFFINQYKSPYKEGIIIEKTRNGYTVIKNIVTSQTNKITD